MEVGLGSHILHLKFSSKSDYLVTCRHSGLCLEAMVSDCCGGTGFPAVTKLAVLSVEMLKSYSY